VIRFERVTFQYAEAAAPVLDEVSLEIEAGEFVLVVGVSGAGKSTLLRCVNGLVPHFSGGTLSGRIRVNGLDPVEMSPQVMSRHVGFVFQDPEAQFVMDRVEDELAFALENAAIPPQEMRIRVEEVLDLLDLVPLRSRRLETLSGGERQRVAIASALAFRPEVLVLDEPTSQLDPKSAEDVLQALVRLNSDMELTVLLAEHRLERVLPFVDRMVVLGKNGAGVRAGPPQELLQDMTLVPPLVTLGQALAWQPLPMTIKDGRRFSRRITVSPSSVADIAAPEDRTAGPPRVEVRQLAAAYDQSLVVEKVNLAIQPGEIVALMGRNGAGKSTVLKSMVGLVRPRQGQVMVNGRDVRNDDVAAICRQVGYLPQNPNALLFADTVAEELEITLRNHGLTATSAPIAPDELLARLGIADKAGDYPRDLSTGERQRVALAAIMVPQPETLLLDEPTRGLDYGAKQGLLDLLLGWREQGLAVVLVTHDVELAAAAATRVVLMSQGEIIAEGSPATVLGASPLFAPQVARLFPDSGWLTVHDALQGLGYVPG
jgi:energy-coupling factor transporter ATP-binding protein EcfA2